MGVKSPVGLTGSQLSHIASDNDTAQRALTKRAEALDKTINSVEDKLANDAGLTAYPSAMSRLEKIKSAAKNGKVVIDQELDIRDRLGEAAKTGDQQGVKRAQTELTALKKNNPKIYGKGSTASPRVDCPNGLSTAACDMAFSQVTYKPNKDDESTWIKGPGTSTKPQNPCYGTSLAEWDGWDNMISHGCATAEERDMITAMSSNEGSFEAVQSYDSQVLTVGVMQKTVNTTGGGELTDQLAAFKKNNSESYKQLFSDHGWTVENGKTYYKDAVGINRTGSQLQSYLRSASSVDQARALGPFRTAGRDPAFRSQQVCDFIKRAHQATDKLISIGDDDYLAGDFITSTRGKAMLLDSSVNGGPNESTFQKSIDWFYKKHPSAGTAPTAWSPEERAQNEAAILNHYAATRRVAAPVTATRITRNNSLAELSAAPNPNGLASQRPLRACPDCA